MKIFFAPYELQGRSSFSNRQGALLRFQFQNGSVGYADCHPWRELGNLSLEEQLSRLREGKFTPLTSRALAFAGIDAKARSLRKSLFSNVKIPPSHWLMEDAEQAIPDGFAFIKLKVGKNPSDEIPRLISLFSQLPNPLKIRLDFNARLSKKGFEAYLSALRQDADKIDFIEDPFPYDPNSWKTLQNKRGVRLACDHLSEKRLNDIESYSVAVIKPAVQDEQVFRDNCGQQLVVTSYLDHPLGQLAAAYVAAHLRAQFPGRIEHCGLLSHLVYQTNKFSEQLRVKDAVLIPPEGVGFGFDELLRNQPWKDLS